MSSVAATGARQPLLVVGVISTERQVRWRQRLRHLYQPYVDRGIVQVFYILDGSAQNGLIMADEIGVPVSHRPDRHCAHKMIGFWKMAGRWPATYYLKTDDDVTLDLPRIVPLLESLPRHRLFSGILRYSLVNETTLEGVCWSAGANGALNKRRRASCKGDTIRGPFPFAEGPFVLMSADVQAWVGPRLKKDPRQQCHFEDLLLGRELAQHRELQIVNLDFLLGQPNVVSSRGEWLGTNGPVAHWTRSEEHFIKTIESFRRASQSLPVTSAFPKPPCAPWGQSFRRLHEYPCCQNWTLCDGPEVVAYWKDVRQVYQGRVAVGRGIATRPAGRGAPIGSGTSKTKYRAARDRGHRRRDTM